MRIWHVMRRMSLPNPDAACDVTELINEARIVLGRLMDLSFGFDSLFDLFSLLESVWWGL